MHMIYPCTTSTHGTNNMIIVEIWSYKNLPQNLKNSWHLLERISKLLPFAYE
jgi:hypothetical protein